MNTFMQFDQFAADRLKMALSNKIGFMILSKPDCCKLSDILLKEQSGYLSESTIYRLFFQHQKHRPYKSTLDVICRFLGHNDYYSFAESIHSSRQQLHWNGISSAPGKSNGLVFYCIENEAKGALTDFFVETNDLSNEFKTDVSVAIFDSLLKSTQQDWFFKEFANQKYIREYFFEKSHDTKFRIKNYDKAYFNYLKGLKIEKEIGQFQDYLFGNCVLFRYYYLSGKRTLSEKQGKLLYSQKLDVSAHQAELFIFPFIRFTAYKLWYLQLTSAPEVEMLSYSWYLIDLCKKLKNGLSNMEQRIVFHTLAETFIYSRVPVSFHWELKSLFKDAFMHLPEQVYKKHLKYSLPYFNENGLLNWRP